MLGINGSAADKDRLTVVFLGTNTHLQFDSIVDQLALLYQWMSGIVQCILV